MIKKLSILLFLIITPVILIQLYNHYFEYAENWLGDYQNYFKLGFLIISILGSLWLILISKKERNIIWLSCSIVLLLLLLAYLYFALIIINTSL